MSFVRQSKLRHVYGEEQKLRFEEVRPSTLTSEGHLVKCNGSFLAFSWNISGGGALCVLGMNETGRLSPDHALIKGHTSNILDFDFNPFNDQQILTSCEDALIRLWEFPASGLTEDLLSPLAVLKGHSRKVGLVTFNPAAAYICASASFDYTVKVWSVETGTPAYSVGPLTETCLSLNWDSVGRLLGTTWRDKHARVIDPRTESFAQDFQCHEGGKASKFCWVNDSSCFTCGFTKQSERQLCLWDIRNPAKALHQQIIDQASGVIMPFFDADTGVLFLAGKGDGNIRYYEVVSSEPYVHFIESFKSIVPCQGVSFIPKRKVDVSRCEIMRAAKLTNSTVELISFIVPRRVEGFQDDLYPDCVGGVPGCSAAQWLEGSNAQPRKMPMSELMMGGAAQASEVTFTPTAPLTSAPDTSKAKQQVDSLEVAVKARDDEISDLKATNHRLQAELSSLQSLYSQSTSTISALRSQLDNAPTPPAPEITELKVNSEYQRTLITALEQETEELRSELERMKEVLMVKTQEERMLKEQIERLQRELYASKPQE